MPKNVAAIEGGMLPQWVEGLHLFLLSQVIAHFHVLAQ